MHEINRRKYKLNKKKSKINALHYKVLKELFGSYIALSSNGWNIFDEYTLNKNKLLMTKHSEEGKL